MDALLAELTAITGAEHVLTGPDVTAGYETDWTRRFRGVARCVVRPGDVDQVARVLLACARHGTPVVPRGGNTGLVGGGAPPAGGAKAAMMHLSRSPAEIAAMRAIKRALDPAGLLNPGVLFAPLCG